MPKRKAFNSYYQDCLLDEGLVFECIKIRIIKEYDL